jgi:hypothetical protein
MSVSITINKLTLCHKGDGMGTVTATVPDVCKTPPNAIPIPYPNIAFATDLAGGTTTIFVDGGNMAAHSASVFSKSSGDEPGTMGGVKSGVNKAEASWLSYSMDVFLEGLNACRLTDKMLLNHGNTVSMGGFLTDWLKDWVKAALSGTIDCEGALVGSSQWEDTTWGVWLADARRPIPGYARQSAGLSRKVHTVVWRRPSDSSGRLGMGDQEGTDRERLQGTRPSDVVLVGVQLGLGHCRSRAHCAHCDRGAVALRWPCR